MIADVPGSVIALMALPLALILVADFALQIIAYVRTRRAVRAARRVIAARYAATEAGETR